ncbi:MAG: shikimate dehydrogenase [Candidatus Omnitrophica bacterium]|nr:shikimate dehydrogenase [Candidatus Omnitrophota bacterium]
MDKYGVIGWPIEHSLSPAMHNAAFKALGIDAVYEKIPVKPEDLEDFLLNNRECKGFNITVPHKVRAKEILDRYPETIGSDYADLCGAINVVKKKDGKFEYANTDVQGFLTSLEKDLKFDRKNSSVLLLGCGGAGRAVIAGLQENCAEIYAYDESKEAVESCKNFSKIKFISGKDIEQVIKKCNLLVNATPVGMKKGDASPIDKGLIHKNLFVYDVVYNRETELVKAAKPRSAGGLGMLLYQGAHAFEFWTGKKAPIDTMRKALTSQNCNAL